MPRLLLALAAGALTVLAFAPLQWYLLAVIGPALWWSTLSGMDARRAAGLGFLFGLGFFGFGISWVFNSLLIFGQAPLVMAVLLTGLLVLYLALYPAILAYVVVRITPVDRPRALFLLAGGWVLLEFLRGWLLTGFPWLYLGHALLDSPLQGWLPVVGEMGASLIVVLLAAALLLLLRQRLPVLALGILLSIGLATAALQTQEWVRPMGSGFTAGLVQANIPQERKWQDDGREYSLERYLSLSALLPRVDVLVWPETAIPVFAVEIASDLEWLAEEFAAEGIEWVTGLFDYDPITGRMFNSLHVPAQGGVYHKRQLVPFGEYLPLRGQLTWLRGVLEIPMSDLSSGEGDGLLDVAGYRAGASICFEAAFARRIRSALPEAHFLMNLSNDAWFGNSLAPYQHLQIARIRALEAGRPMLRATNTGISAIIAADGRVITASGVLETALVVGEVIPHTGQTPATVLGPWPALAFSLALLWPALRRRAQQVH